MSTVQALFVGGVVGFIVGSAAWMFLGIAIGMLQNGVEDALREKLELDQPKEKENASS